MRRVLVCTAVAVLACGGNDEAASSNEGTQAAATQSSGPRGNATISGTVSFAGNAPANPAIDMSAEAECKAKHAGTVSDPQYVVKNGKVANVFVYVKSGLPAGASYTAPSEAVTIDQDGCLYKPRVFGTMVGQTIDIKNSDPVLHNIKAVPKENRGFNISQPRPMVTKRSFNRREVMVPLECNVHSWMQAYVGVLDHPFFATTNDNGAFEIKGLPPGTYEIEAWHEKLGPKTMTVTVGDGESKTADFSYTAPRA
ncbi:MAG: carboxypeptidase regulatory-like domain-containing protein [Gemmatimonadaceae bacterium]